MFVCQTAQTDVSQSNRWWLDKRRMFLRSISRFSQDAYILSDWCSVHHVFLSHVDVEVSHRSALRGLINIFLTRGLLLRNKGSYRLLSSLILVNKLDLSLCIQPIVRLFFGRPIRLTVWFGVRFFCCLLDFGA